jgi:hypothetical protein
MNCAWLRLIRESAYKVPVTPTTLNTDFLVIELLDDDPFNVEPAPTTEQLFSWLACGDPDRGIGETYAIEGPLRTLLYPDQAALLLGWAVQPVAGQGDAGNEVPWLTSEPAGQMASMTADFAYSDDDGVERKARYLGGKVTSFTLTADRGTRDGAFVLELQTAWSERTTTTATAPPASEYPSAATPPYFLGATSGNVTIDGETISNYTTLSIEGNYTAPIVFDEDPFIKRIRHRRKEFMLNMTGRLKVTPDWRALRDNRSIFDATVVMEYPGGAGAQSLTWDMGGNVRVSGPDGWSKSLPLNADRMQSLSLISQFDRDLSRTLALTIGVQA